MSEYPPTSSPTSIVVKPVIEKLQANYEVYILSIGKSNNYLSSDHKIKLYTVHGGVEKNDQKSFFLTKLSRLKLRLQQIFNIPIFPVLRPIVLKRFKDAALSICEKEKIDCIISVCFPQEAVAAGSYVKTIMPEITFVPYIIDAFAGGTLPKYLPSKYARKKKIDFENKVTKNSDLIIAMESAKPFYVSHDMIDNHYFLNPALLKSNEVTNLTGDEKSGHLDCTKINILYTGYLYLPDRNPSYVIHLISALRLDNVCLSFIGNCSEDVLKVIEAEKVDFYGELKHIGFVQHDELKSWLNDADILLNLGVSNSNAISGKIFEYMAYGKPILTTYFDENDAALPYLKRYPLSFCINQDNESLEIATQNLRRFIDNSLGKKVPYEYVKKEFYSSTPEAFVELIDSIWREKKYENRYYI